MLKTLEKKFDDTALDQRIHAACTFKIKRSQKSIKAITKTRIEPDENAALLYMMRRAGFKVHSGKVQREGLIRALQEVLTRRQK